MTLCNDQSKMRLTLNREYEPQRTEPQQIKTPEYFPSRMQVRSAKMITCVTHNGVTKCWGSSARSGQTVRTKMRIWSDFRKTTRIVEDSTTKNTRI